MSAHARDDEPTQVTRLRDTLRKSLAGERVELAACATLADEVACAARRRPSSRVFLVDLETLEELEAELLEDDEDGAEADTEH